MGSDTGEVKKRERENVGNEKREREKGRKKLGKENRERTVREL